MSDFYSIIIPIYNEQSKIELLLSKLKYYKDIGHEIIIVDDGSDDNSNIILSKCHYISLITLEKNKGKGVALRHGLLNASNNKIIIYDGDLELDPIHIKSLMILHESQKDMCVFAARDFIGHPFFSFWKIGNYFFTVLFNFLNNTNVKDALCCAKSFYKSDLNISQLKSTKFDIDVEIASLLALKCKKIINVNIEYKRRKIKDGKKLRFTDSWLILKRIIFKTN